MNPVDLSLYLVTDTRLCGDRGVPETVRRAVRGGVTAVQLRDHDATTRELCVLGDALRQELSGTGVPLLIDDRLDVALAVHADGVHLGQSDMDARAAREIAGERLIIGHSVSCAQQARDAANLPIDYLGVGPFRATPTKPDAAEPLGPQGVAEIIGSTSHPAVVIGGIGGDDVAAVLAAGARGVAVVSAICSATDPEAAARDLRARLEEAA